MAKKTADPASDNAMLEPRFRVERTDPHGMIEHRSCDYLVLDITHPTMAEEAAIEAYAAALAEGGESEKAKALRARAKAKYRPGMKVTALEVVSGEQIPAVLVRKSPKHSAWIARPDFATIGLTDAPAYPEQFFVRETDLSARAEE